MSSKPVAQWQANGASGPIVCGHRGVPGAQPENTLASFREAARRGATWVEFDVRPTGDSQLAIHHDPATSSGVHLGSTPYGELDPSIPRFADLVVAEPGLGLDIEMKTDGIDTTLGSFVSLVIDQINEHCAGRTNLIVTSFDSEALQLIRDRQPSLPTGLLFWKQSHTEAIAIARDAGHVAIAPSIKLLSADVVDLARQESLGVATWTVNEPTDIARAAKLGVDMIIGDDPAMIIANL